MNWIAFVNQQVPRRKCVIILINFTNFLSCPFRSLLSFFWVLFGLFACLKASVPYASYPKVMERTPSASRWDYLSQIILRLNLKSNLDLTPIICRFVLLAVLISLSLTWSLLNSLLDSLLLSVSFIAWLLQSIQTLSDPLGLQFRLIVINYSCPK